MIRNFLRLPSEALAEPRRRSPLLERALARAARVNELPDWRAAAFGVLSKDPMPPLAPLSLPAEPASMLPAAAEFPWVWLATPLHLEPGLDNVRLPADGIVRLSSAELTALAEDFGRLWADAPLRLAGVGERLYLFSSTPWPALTHDPETFLGEHIDEYLPQGAGAPRLKALMSEIEMWLFEHRVNRERTSAGKAVATGLWLWGGGERGPRPTSDFAAAGADPLFGAFRGAGPQVRVVVASHAPGSEGWSAVEEPWLASRLTALSGDAALAISIKRRSFEVTAGWRWRLFHKPRAWWEYFE